MRDDARSEGATMHRKSYAYKASMMRLEKTAAILAKISAEKSETIDIEPNRAGKIQYYMNIYGQTETLYALSGMGSGPEQLVIKRDNPDG